MKIALKKKSRWERIVEPIVSRVNGTTLTVNGKAVSPDAIRKPASRALGGLVIATVASAIVSSVRRQDDE